MRSLTFGVCLLSLALSAAAGEAYTNLAGKVIAATPVRVEGQTVAFDCGTAGVRSLPLGAFLPSEQKRIKAAVGIREMPGGLKGLAAEIRYQRARYEARAKAGKLTAEKLAENLEMLAGSWRLVVDETDLPPEEKSYWKENVP